MSESSPKTKKQKNILEVIKLYLSSLSARSCKYLYFNCLLDAPRTLVLTNGDDQLFIKDASDLTIHLLEINDDELFAEFKNVFNFMSNEPYVVHLKKCLDVINKCIKNKDTLKTYLDIGDQLILTVESDDRQIDDLRSELMQEAKLKLEKDIENGVFREMADEDEDELEEDELDTANILLPLLEYSHAFGMPIKDHRIMNIIQEHALNTLVVYQELPSLVTVKIHTDNITLLRSNIYIVKINLDMFNRPDIYTDDYIKDYNYLIQDGLDMPSIKEFIKKLNKEQWDSNTYLYIARDKRLSLLSVFLNDDINIISTRPFVGITPLIKYK